MGVFRNIAIAILTLSLVVFCALFGSLPRFRKTPIGFINRLIWIKLPSTLLSVDRLLTGGRTLPVLMRVGNYLMNENHPLVLAFYLLILSTSQILFLPAALPHLSLPQTLPLPPIIIVPYLLTYLTVTSTASLITPSTHRTAMTHYPYDHILFHPHTPCRTCLFPKPARSKHCSLCNACVAKHDHHCVWVMNCIGRSNQGLFLAMLFSLGLQLVYGGYLAYSILSTRLQADYAERYQGYRGIAAAVTGASRLALTAAQAEKVPAWSEGKGWQQWMDAWLGVFAGDIRVGGVGLLAAFTAPLAWGLLAYHLYLIWAGMTTSESFKWEEWRDDVAGGLVYRCAEPRGERGRGENGELRVGGGEGGGGEEGEPKVDWPVESKMRLISRANRRSLEAEPDADLSKPEWVQITSLAEVVNIYDLGFWDNLADCFHWK